MLYDNSPGNVCTMACPPAPHSPPTYPTCARPPPLRLNEVVDPEPTTEELLARLKERLSRPTREQVLSWLLNNPTGSLRLTPSEVRRHVAPMLRSTPFQKIPDWCKKALCDYRGAPLSPPLDAKALGWPLQKLVRCLRCDDPTVLIGLGYSPSEMLHVLREKASIVAAFGADAFVADVPFAQWWVEDDPCSREILRGVDDICLFRIHDDKTIENFKIAVSEERFSRAARLCRVMAYNMVEFLRQCVKAAEREDMRLDVTKLVYTPTTNEWAPFCPHRSEYVDGRLICTWLQLQEAGYDIPLPGQNTALDAVEDIKGNRLDSVTTVSECFGRWKAVRLLGPDACMHLFTHAEFCELGLVTRDPPELWQWVQNTTQLRNACIGRTPKWTELVAKEGKRAFAVDDMHPANLTCAKKAALRPGWPVVTANELEKAGWDDECVAAVRAVSEEAAAGTAKKKEGEDEDL